MKDAEYQGILNESKEKFELKRKILRPGAIKKIHLDKGILDLLEGGVMDERLTAPYDHQITHTLGSSNWETACDISGKGKAKVNVGNLISGNNKVRITVDGILVDNEIFIDTDNAGSVLGFYYFDQSFKVEHQNSSGAAAIIHIAYYLEE